MTRNHPAAAPNPQQTSQGIDWVEGGIQGGTMLLTVVKQAAKLTPVPYLSQAADLTLTLVTVAQTVRDNKQGFQGLVADATQLVAVFWRSYQGAEDKKKWLETGEIRASVRDVIRTLESTVKLGKQMNSRNIFLRVLFYLSDVDTIKSNRQKLNTAVSQFQVDKVAAQLDMHEALAQITRKQDEILDEIRSKPDPASRRAAENERRAREWERVEIRDIANAGIALGSGDVDVQNVAANRQNGPRPQPDARERARRSPSPNAGGGLPMATTIERVYNSGVAAGSGSVSVRNEY